MDSREAEAFKKRIELIAALVSSQLPDNYSWGLAIIPSMEELQLEGKGGIFWISNVDPMDLIVPMQHWIDAYKEQHKVQ